jgi:hypothetical protein
MTPGDAMTMMMMMIMMILLMVIEQTVPYLVARSLEDGVR